MKNNIITIFSLFLLTAFLACDNKMNSLNTSNASKTPSFNIDPLKDRNSTLATSADWQGIKIKADELTKKIEMNPNDSKSKLLLAQIYMKEARVTGEHPYYYPATLKILDNILKTDSTQFEALAFKASVLLSLTPF